MRSQSRTRTAWRSLQRTRWTADDARRALAALRASDESTYAFARRHGLNPQRLYWWQDRLDEWEATPAAGGALVPVVSDVASVPVRLRLPDGATVEIDSEAVAAAWVASLLRELSSASEK